MKIKDVMKALDGVAAVNLAEPSPGDLERIVNAYNEERIAYSKLLIITNEIVKALERFAKRERALGLEKGIAINAITQWYEFNEKIK